MNGFKRFLNIIFALLVLVSYVILIMMAWPLSGFDTELPPYINTWFYIGVASVIVLGIFVVTRLVKSFMRPAGSRDLTEQKDGGTVQIAVEALRTIATKTALDQPHVNSAETEVRQAGKDAAIDLKMSMKVQNEALEKESVKDFAERIKEKVSAAVSNFSGYPIHNFDIKVDVDDVQAPENLQAVAPAPLNTEVKAEAPSSVTSPVEPAAVQAELEPVKPLDTANTEQLEPNISMEKAELDKAIHEAKDGAVKESLSNFDDHDRDFVLKP